jgi:hypothetical protein
MCCSECGIDVRPIRHEFRVGSLPNDHRPPDWVINAPLYFRASSDGRRAVAAFCGTECSAKWLGP